jgi:hypothetical protein
MGSFAAGQVRHNSSKETLFFLIGTIVAYPARPYPEVTVAVLPSSLTRVLSNTLVYSTRAPESVCGTGGHAYDTLKLFRSARPPDSPLLRESHLLPCGNLDGYSQKSALGFQPRTLTQLRHRYGNINPLSIAYATRLGLGPTNPGTIIVAQETLLFRWAGFSPAL